MTLRVFLNVRWLWAAAGSALLLLANAWPPAAHGTTSMVRAVQAVQPKIVKIYGAGGVRRLEAYQTGLLVSNHGHVLTIWSYVLDADPVTVVLNDGRRYEADLVGADPAREIAVLKIGVSDQTHFELQDAVRGAPGAAVLAFTNAFGVATGNEPVSVLHGWISAVTTLKAQSGVHESPYQGPIYVVDAITSNPGAAGGAVTDHRGRLLGIVGRELRDTASRTWLNYVIPAATVAESVAAMIEGRQVPEPAPDSRAPDEPWSLDKLGIVLVPDVLTRTPPFVDAVRPDSPAARVGLRADDLIVFLNGRLLRSCGQLKEALERLEASEPVNMTVLRDGDLVGLTMTADK